MPPVVLFIFNRPQTTRQVFEVIRLARPRQLFVIADGPRPERREDAELCRQARSLCIPDWPCELVTNLASVNLGCGKRLVSGLDWVFAQVEEAILLEDDCLPDPSFFPYCEELLAHYRNSPQVMHIGGHNRLLEWLPESGSYHATLLYGSPCGWATWRRAWQCFRRDAGDWRSLAEGLANTQISWTAEMKADFLAPFRTFKPAQLEDEWGILWTLSKLLKGGVSLFPARNLISNIGFGADATHTKGRHALLFQNTPRWAMDFPLRHPATLQVDQEYDQRHLSWSHCRPDPDLLQPLLDHLIAANRLLPALLLIEHTLRRVGTDPCLEERKASLLLQLRPGEQGPADLSSC